MKSFKQFLTEEMITVSNSIVSPEVEKKFMELARSQRKLPEQAMNKVQALQICNLYSYALEHIGDINHRMNEHINSFNGQQNIVLKKLRMIKRDLDRPDYFFGEIHVETVDNYNYFKNKYPDTYEFRNLTVDQVYDVLKKASKEYSIEHSKLKVYNYIQWLARESAMALGIFDFKYAKQCIDELYDMVDDGRIYIKAIAEFEEDYNQKHRTYVSLS